MKQQRCSVLRFGLILTLLAVACTTQARDEKHMYPIEDVVANSEYKSKINEDIALYFGDQSHPAVAENLGEYISNKKTNAFGKSDVDACQWVMLSAIMSLQERALREGGDAVVNIRSYYKKDEVSSTSKYECHAGNIMAGVTLIGEVVKFE